jgi:hypothetical protein
MANGVATVISVEVIIKSVDSIIYLELALHLSKESILIVALVVNYLTNDKAVSSNCYN